jgi:hypothetical protein
MSFKYSGFMMVTLGVGPNHVKEFLPKLFFLIRIIDRSTGPLIDEIKSCLKEDVKSSMWEN